MKKGDSRSENPGARRNLWAHYQETNTWKKAVNLWNNHWLTITVAVLDIIVILYSVIGILNIGFEKAVGLFIIGLFVWFCLTYMVVRDCCGEELYQWLIKPVVDAINNNWTRLKWYVNVRCLCFKPSHTVKC